MGEQNLAWAKAFFNEIIQPSRTARHEHPQRRSNARSLGLDLYLWLAYRTFTLQRSAAAFTWRAALPAVRNGPSERATDKNSSFKCFRRKDSLRELKKIKLAWPDLHYSTAKGVLILLPSKHRRSRRWPRRYSVSCPIALRIAPGVERTQGGAASGGGEDGQVRWEKSRQPTSERTTKDRKDPSATFASEAKFSLCGVFLYESEQLVAPADPSCKKCLRLRHSPRRMKGRPESPNVVAE